MIRYLIFSLLIILYILPSIQSTKINLCHNTKIILDNQIIDKINNKGYEVQFDGEIIKYLNAWKNYMVHNTILEKILSDNKEEYVLVSCGNVETLEIRSDNLKGINMGIFTNLNTLILDSVTPDILTKIREISSLENLIIKKVNQHSLDLSKMGLKDIDIYSCYLSFLDISKNQINNETLSELARQVTHIDISDNDIESLDFTRFNDNILQKLIIKNNPVKGEKDFLFSIF